jgi:cob(I)alamin adenosyltransferase
MSGYIHLYTGNGKGKTTAALGLAIRAVGAGKSVFIAQFVKGMRYSEIEALSRFPEMVLKQYGLDCFIINEPTQHDIDLAQMGLADVTTLMAQHTFEVLILDEICIALHYNLLRTDQVLALLKTKPMHTEIILTGRYAPDALYEIADLVTEMTEVKHYYKRGIKARKGIEY